MKGKLEELLEVGRNLLDSNKVYYFIKNMSTPVLSQELKEFLKRDQLQINIIENPFKVTKMQKEEPEQKTVLFDNKENFEKTHDMFVLELQEIEDFLKKDGQGDIYLKQIDQYKKALERVKKNSEYKIKKSDEEEYSTEVTYQYMDIIEKEYIKIFRKITNGRKIKNERFFIDLEKLMEEYLEKLHIARKDISVREGEIITEECYDYTDIAAVTTKDKNLSRKIKQIDCMPYKVNYFDEDGDTKEYIIRGKINVYRYEGGE